MIINCSCRVSRLEGGREWGAGGGRGARCGADWREAQRHNGQDRGRQQAAGALFSAFFLTQPRGHETDPGGKRAERKETLERKNKKKK